MSPRLRRAAKVALVVAMLALAAFTLRGIDLRAIGRSFAALPHATVGVAIALSLAQAMFMATRLWSVFPSHARPGWLLVARAFGFGQLVNTYTPGRAGDVVKVLAIARDESEPDAKRATVADATGVLIADKGLDAMALFLLVALFGHHLLRGLVAGAHPSPLVAIALACAAAIAFVALRSRPAIRAKIGAWLASTLRAARGLLTPSRLGMGLTLALAGWAAEVALLVVLAAPMGVHLTFAQATVGLLVLNLGIAVPVSVANLGAYEAATVVGLAPFGASTAQALAIGTLHHAIQLATVVLFATAFWLRDRIAGRGERRIDPAPDCA